LVTAGYPYQNDPVNTPGGREQTKPGPEGAPGFACQVTSINGEFMSTILLIVLVLLVVGALPTWPYSSGWGYYPSGGLGMIVVIVLILVLMGRV
jgi:hypothetical protein